MSTATLDRRQVTTADDRLLQAAATFFTVAVLLHGADHVRRGTGSIQASVFWAGTLAIAVEAAPVVLAFMRHPLAPLASVSAGFGLAAGYLFVHFTPQRSWLSDSIPGGGASWMTWTAASLETAAALVLGVTGALVLHRRGLVAAAEGPSGSLSD